VAEIHDAVGRLIDDWQSARAELAEIERAEYPDITDHHGRVWVWWKGDLYRHCGLAFPEDWIINGRPGRDRLGLPSQAVLDNPNYGHLCDICMNGRTRNVPPCKPEWNCDHVMHQGGDRG
jgi:hypothetical protein